MKCLFKAHGFLFETEVQEQWVRLSDSTKNSNLYRNPKEAKAIYPGIKTMHEGYRICPYWVGGCCEVLGHAYPEDCELEKIPEEYR